MDNSKEQPMKSYLKCTVTTHTNKILVFAVNFSRGDLISILAQTNKSVLVEESVCHDDAYDHLNWVK